MRFRLSSRGRQERSPSEPSSPDGFDDPVAKRTSPAKAAGCAVAFFSVFLLAGLAFSAFFAWPLLRVFESRSWSRVPCEVLESGVATHPGEDNDTYSVEVLYRYEVGGREYRSDRYHFFLGSTSGYEGKARVVEGLPAGTRTTCWVDPEDPTEAVLSRELTLEYLFGLLPLVFVVVGAGGIVYTLVGVRKLRTREAASRPAWLPDQEAEPAFASHEGSPGAGPVVLEAKHSPLGKLVTITLIALFWNGIVSVFVFQAWKGWSSGAPDGCLTVFLVPFVLIGALFLVSVPYQFLALFNPRPRVTLTPGSLVLGGEAELRWGFRGRAGRIRRLRVTLEGVEEADVSQGKETRTRRETFATYDLVDSTHAVEIASGATRITVPADTMHTFEAPDNRILWTLKLSGEIRLWPDVAEEMRVVIHPVPLEEPP